jgi:hypothetical protein
MSTAQQNQPAYKHFFERTMDTVNSKGIVFSSDEKATTYSEDTVQDASTSQQQSPLAKFQRNIKVENSKGVWWGLKDDDKDGKFNYSEKIRFSRE